MKSLKRQKKLSVILAMLIAVFGLVGCGSNPASDEQQTPLAGNEETADSESRENEADDAASIEEQEQPEDEKPLQYVEVVSIEDYYGDKALYDIYAPIGNENEDGFIIYTGHGIQFLASVWSGFDTGAYLEICLTSSVEDAVEEMQEDERYSNIKVSDVLKSGSDRYQIITAKKEDMYGTPYDFSEVYYMNIRGKGIGVLWQMEMREIEVDEETDFIIDELARCYEINLDDMKASGGWILANEERIKQEEEAKLPPKTVLWFNATYAPLTYSNLCDWTIVGGMEATEYNQEFDKSTLNRDWGIDDRASAIETVERLIEDGHRAKCRECMEELDEMGILEADEETFLQGLIDSGIEENLFRYVIAYYIHQDGKDAEYMAAWDLCRANQLYADFYVCGYMTYEEAMDASFENSLKLQKMYSSWDELVNAYLLGYQFWQNDPCTSEFSPTMRRYQCYQDLLAMEDGPYTLDWNMELEKSW